MTRVSAATWLLLLAASAAAGTSIATADAHTHDSPHDSDGVSAPNASPVTRAGPVAGRRLGQPASEEGSPEPLLHELGRAPTWELPLSTVVPAPEWASLQTEASAAVAAKAWRRVWAPWAFTGRNKRHAPRVDTRDGSLPYNSTEFTDVGGITRYVMDVATADAFAAQHRAMKAMRREAQEARRLGNPNTDDDALPTVELGGGVDDEGLIYLRITLGEGKAPMHVQLDTGSSDTAVPASPCRTCNHSDPLWQPATDAGAQKVGCNAADECADSCKDDQCELVDEYGDNSGFSALWWMDKVGLANSNAAAQTGYVAAIFTETPVFETGDVDGISGFAYQELSGSGLPPIIDSITQGLHLWNQIALCMAGSKGAVVIGGQYGPVSDIKWTPVIDPGYFTVYLEALEVDGVRVPVSSSVYNDDGCIMDSGTSAVYMPAEVISAIYTTMRTYCNSVNIVGVCNTTFAGSIFGGEYCFALTQDELNAYPPISLVLGKSKTIRVDWEAKDYLSAETMSGRELRCFETYPGDDGMLFGDLFLRGQQTLFDKGNNRVGFSPVRHCGSWGG